MIRRFRQQREHDRRRRLARDAERARLWLVALISEARRVGAPVPPEIPITVQAWSLWILRLRDWAEGSDWDQ